MLTRTRARCASISELAQLGVVVGESLQELAVLGVALGVRPAARLGDLEVAGRVRRRVRRGARRRSRPRTRCRSAGRSLRGIAGRARNGSTRRRLPPHRVDRARRTVRRCRHRRCWRRPSRPPLSRAPVRNSRRSSSACSSVWRRSLKYSRTATGRSDVTSVRLPCWERMTPCGSAAAARRARRACSPRTAGRSRARTAGGHRR